MRRAAVLGAGSWGTAFAMVLAEAGTEVTLLARREPTARLLQDSHRNPDYLPDIELPAAVRATSNPAEALDGADLVVLAVPAQSLRENLEKWTPMVSQKAVLASLIKGIELHTAKRMSEVIREVVGAPPDRVAVVSGPNLAGEIANRQPAATVVACVDPGTAERLQQACLTGYFRPYTNLDVTGCELGGAVKNVIAVACGIAVGMELGDNALAALMTRGLAETARLGAALGADPLTFAGLAGLGDLVVTCTSPRSRNRTFGERLGRGASLEQVLASTRQTAEGVKSCQSIAELGRRHDVEMPITEHVVGVVHEGLQPTEMVRSLMSRDARPERTGRLSTDRVG